MLATGIVAEVFWVCSVICSSRICGNGKTHTHVNRLVLCRSVSSVQGESLLLPYVLWDAVIYISNMRKLNYITRDRINQCACVGASANGRLGSLPSTTWFRLCHICFLRLAPDGNWPWGQLFSLRNLSGLCGSARFKLWRVAPTNGRRLKTAFPYQGTKRRLGSLPSN